MRLILRLALALTIFSCAIAVAADATATILGTVRDATGALIPSARIAAVNEQTGLKREATSSGDGGYVLPLLPAGRYRVTIEAPSFKRYERQGITLAVSQNARIDAALEIGAISESVSVTGDATLVDTASAALKEVVDPMRMENLPLNGRDILQFQFLLPGITPSPGETQALTGPFVPVSAAINGVRAASNNYLLDGGEATD
ncbi:MAG: carboxypeptidase-like regulatory domain-containing protein, partial [Bryobacteraceae bacterium]